MWGPGWGNRRKGGKKKNKKGSVPHKTPWGKHPSETERSLQKKPCDDNKGGEWENFEKSGTGKALKGVPPLSGGKCKQYRTIH